MSCMAVVVYDQNIPSHPYIQCRDGAHVGFSVTRQALLAPSARDQGGEGARGGVRANVVHRIEIRLALHIYKSSTEKELGT